MNDIVSNIKNLFALTAVLFLFTALAGGGGGGASFSDAKTNRGSSAASNGTAAITSISAASISGPTPILESTSTSEATSTPKPTPAPSPTPVDLESDSIYHYKIISEDADGNRVVSEDRIFKTKSDGTVLSEPVSEQEPTPTPTSTPASVPEPTPPSTNESMTTIPEGATVITGLKAGATVEAAKNNSNVLNAALDGGNKNLIIPSGTWYTGATVYVYKNTILTFDGAKLQQLPEAAAYKDYYVVRTMQENITLNNPYLSQKGRVHPHGTHACLAVYGSNHQGNVTINGGILEWGASNCFQGGRNNTVFNGTIFRDSVEHLVYGNGIGGGGEGSGGPIADGLTFNDCIFERPGNGLYKELEANHIQIRNYKNIELNNCTVSGTPKTDLGQYALLLTSVENCTVNGGSFDGQVTGLLFTSPDERHAYPYPMANVVFNNVIDKSSGNKRIRTSRGDAGVTTFNNCTLNRPYKVDGRTTFNSCTIKGEGYGNMVATSGSNLTFNNCTWDYSDSTSGQALVKDSGATTNFKGTQTKIAPSDGQSFSWSPLPTAD